MRNEGSGLSHRRNQTPPRATGAANEPALAVVAPARRSGPTRHTVRPYNKLTASTSTETRTSPGKSILLSTSRMGPVMALTDLPRSMIWKR